MWKSKFTAYLKRCFNRKFVVKATAFCAVTFSLGSALAYSSYSIAFETQNVIRCLPQVLWILDSDVHPENIHKASLVKLNGANYNSYFDEKTYLLKMVVAIEGDVVFIDQSQRTLFINDVFYGKLASDKQPAHTGKYVLQKSEIWIAGTSDTTLDSRYFGPATLGQIEAHAYAVL